MSKSSDLGWWTCEGWQPCNCLRMPEARRFQESRMPGNPLVRFDEGRVGRTRKVSPSLLLYCSSVFIRGQTCFSAIRLLGGAGGPQGTPCQFATPTAALHADRDRGGPARCGCPGSSVSGRSRRRNRTREQRPAAYARLGIEVSAVGSGENVGAIEPHAPEPPEQRNFDVQRGEEQQVGVTGQGAADDETQIHPAIHDPAGRQARGGCGDGGQPLREGDLLRGLVPAGPRSEEHTSELHSL